MHSDNSAHAFGNAVVSRNDAAPSQGIDGVFERAYVINMKGADERWATIQREFAAIGVAPTRIDAVRGSNMTKAERQAAATPTCAALCTPATIGCASSHIKLWKQMLADGVSVALATEDDTSFVPDFRRLAQEYAREFPSDFDIVYFGCFGCQERENAVMRAAMRVIGAKHESRDVSQHVWVPPTALTTHCYLLSAKGARKLLAAIEGRISDHVDKVINKLVGEGVLTAYAVRPLLAHQDVSLAATSISTAKTPRGPSILLDKVRISPEVTWGYAFCAPFGRLGRYTFNLWTPTFFVGGALLGAMSASVAWAVALCVILLMFDLLPMVEGDRDTLIAVIVNTCLAVLGWATGMGIRAGIRALCKGGRAMNACPPMLGAAATHAILV